MKLFDKNNLSFGILLGTISPLLGFVLVAGIFQLLTLAGVMDAASLSTADRRWRTIFILSICTNIYWIRRFNQAFTIRTLRGVTLATMVLCGIWFIYYYPALYAD